MAEMSGTEWKFAFFPAKQREQPVRPYEAKNSSKAWPYKTQYPCTSQGPSTYGQHPTVIPAITPDHPRHLTPPSQPNHPTIPATSPGHPRHPLRHPRESGDPGPRLHHPPTRHSRSQPPNPATSHHPRRHPRHPRASGDPGPRIHNPPTRHSRNQPAIPRQQRSFSETTSVAYTPCQGQARRALRPSCLLLTSLTLMLVLGQIRPYLNPDLSTYPHLAIRG